MDVHLKYTNIKASPTLEQYVYDKIGSLEKYVKDIGAREPSSIDAIHAWVEIGKIGKHHKEGKVWYAECQMRLPGRSLRSTSTHFDIYLAIDEVKDELQKLLKKYKEKRSGTVRRIAKKTGEPLR